MVRLCQLRAVLGAAGGALALTAAAAGQISQSAGVDVIVGDLPAVEHWTDSGAVNGMRSYSVGTTSCNQGSAPLSWLASPNPRHPVINQALYRYAADPSGLVDAGGNPVKRFEQIGQSWLKHGFTALQGSVCSGEFDFPCQPTSGTSLGVGCSDPYSASLNGGQSGLGPKSEINPALGTNLGNHTTPSGGALGGRIQVLESDLTVPGALYFVEGHYIAEDDAAAGNDDNNASYRRVLVDTSDFDLITSGATQRRKAAILAWADQDPSVTVQHVDVPGDGRFTIAYKVTDLGGGVYDYDYAIFNMNSDRAGAALRFPLAPGLTVLASQFNDIDYHSGEPFDNTDWTITNTGTQLIFASPETHAQDPNTNALRWGTTYNFRFRANAAPVAGVMTLDLFKPGTPTSMSIVAMVPSGGVAFNDDCAGALPLSSYGSFPFDTGTATTDGPPDALCAGSNYDSVFQDLWYTYTATCDGQYTVNTCGSSFDTRLAVYAGGCPGAGGAIVACEDDTACPGGGTLQTSLSWTGIAGTEYWIRVGGYENRSGAGTLTIGGPPCLPVPENDLCSNAVALQERTTVNGTTAGAGSDASASCGGAADVFYAFTPAMSNAFDVNVTTGTMGGAVVSVHNGCTGAEVACSAGGSLVANLSGGQTYIIRVATALGQPDGSFALRVQGDIVNDDCADAIPAYEGIPVVGSTTGATGTDISSCSFQDAVDVWYTYTPAVSGSINLRTCEDSSYDTTLAVYNGCGGTQVACMDDNCGVPGFRTNLTFNGVGGTTYYIRVSGYDGETGDFTLRITGGGGAPAPENDLCTNAVSLPDGVAASGTNVGATGTDLTSCTTGDTRDVWYAYSVSADDTITVSTCGSTLDTSLAVFDACGGAQLACNDDNAPVCGVGSTSSQLTFSGEAGQTYLIRVAGWNGNTGTFTITASGGSAPPPPINDDCVNIYAIPANGTLNPIDTTGATLDGPADDGCGAVGADVWFGLGSHVADGTATFSTVGSDYDTVISVYDDSAGTCDNLSTRLIACNDNDSGGTHSQLSVQVEEGHTYVIRVSGRNGATGQLVLTSSFTPAPACVCERDGNDAQVDVFDLLAYLDLWFAQAAGADIDGAAGVDVFDLLSFLDCWFPASAGSPC